MDDLQLIKTPIFLKENRVWRVYQGGKLLGDYKGAKEEDTFYPEEWIASTVCALNQDCFVPQEGLSFVEGTEVTLKELIKKYPDEMLGEQSEIGILVKFLDSAIRLPVQVHPDRDFSEKYLGSSYGKAEMWIVLATRENACIHFGFKNRMSREEFSEAVERSYENREEMESLLNRYTVKPGDIFFIPAKVVHAIGQGCLILEIQEPTDFTIQPEYWCGDYELNSMEMYLNLKKETALECFDFDVYGSACENMVRKIPSLLWEEDCVRKEALITEADTKCFRVNRYDIKKGTTTLTEGPVIYVVTGGAGEIKGEQYCRKVSKGDYFFLSNAARGQFAAESADGMEIVECLPPAGE